MEDGVFFEATQAEPLEAQGQTRAERRDQQIQRILDAAQVCFVRSGFQGASMQQICAECGMSPGALYRYFPSKEAIVAAICAADREDDMTCFGALRDATSAVEGLVDGAMAHITHTHEKGSAPLFAEMRSESCATRRSATRSTATSRRLPEMIVPLLVGAIERGEIDPVVDLQTLMAVLMSVGEGMAINDLPARGIPLEKLEIALRAMLVGMLGRRMPTLPRQPDQSNRTLFPVIFMSTKSSPLMRAALLAATMLAGTPAASYAASEAAPVVKQVPPSIRVVAAEKRELVETLSVNGSIVAREEAAVGTDLNGLTVSRAQCRRGRRGEEGRRARGPRPLDARHPARPDRGEPRAGGSQHCPDARTDR